MGLYEYSLNIPHSLFFSFLWGTFYLFIHQKSARLLSRTAVGVSVVDLHTRGWIFCLSFCVTGISSLGWGWGWGWENWIGGGTSSNLYNDEAMVGGSASSLPLYFLCFYYRNSVTSIHVHE